MSCELPPPLLVFRGMVMRQDVVASVFFCFFFFFLTASYRDIYIHCLYMCLESAQWHLEISQVVTQSFSHSLDSPR